MLGEARACFCGQYGSKESYDPVNQENDAIASLALVRAVHSFSPPDTRLTSQTGQCGVTATSPVDLLTQKYKEKHIKTQ